MVVSYAAMLYTDRQTDRRTNKGLWAFTVNCSGINILAAYIVYLLLLESVVHCNGLHLIPYWNLHSE